MFSRLTRLALLGLALAVATPNAQATSLSQLTLEQYTDASTYVVRGEVSEVWTDLDDQGLVWTHARLRVGRTLKGPDAPNELVIDSLGGSYGVANTQVPGQAGFSKGERILAFLYTSPRTGRTHLVNSFQGKMTIRRAPHETERYVLRWQPSQPANYDHRFLPHPAASDRTSLQSVLDRIQDHLAVGWDGQDIPGISNTELQQLNTPDRRRAR